LSLPNLLTALRILLIPVFVGLLIYERHVPATLVFCAAGVTDLLDGMLARRMHRQTRLGAFLDPTADKLLSVSSFVTLSIKGPIPVWFVVIVLSRDVMLSLGTLILYLSDGTIEIAPSSLGKVTTFLQFLTILVTILFLTAGRGFFLWKAVLLGTALVTILSGLQYLYRGLSSRGVSKPA
jgi:cardiolipin synthase